jgi:hypothetical protein
MYHEHNHEFIVEKTKNIPYWRYMDFWKFLNLINTSKLFFPNIEMLGDQNEGKIPEKIFNMMVNDKKHGEDFPHNYKKMVENLRSRTLISSWSAYKTESFALWKMYAKDRLGIAIKTNYERLKSSFHKTPIEIRIGEVSYYDDNNAYYETGNTYYSFLVKNIYYEFESEVRCIADLPYDDKSSYKLIDVDLNDLIEEIYISPFAYETDIIDMIEFLKSKHNLNFKVNKSGINDNWI